MKLRYKIANWLLSGASEPTNTPSSLGKYGCVSRLGTISGTIGVDPSSPTLSSNNMVLRIYPGRGGIAIETSYYNSHDDRSQTTLHIVPEGDELAPAIAQIISLDLMRVG